MRAPVRRHSLHRAAAVVAALALPLLAPAPSRALTTPWSPYDDEASAYQAEVVQPRRFARLHEFSVSGGLLPSDALYTGVTATFRYALHLSELWAWEIAGGTYSFNLASGAEQRMMERYGLKFTDTERLLVMADSDVVLKPFHGKFAVFNRWVWYAEPYLLGGLALARYTASWRAGPELGAGIRFHVLDWLALHFDTRYHALWSGLPTRPTSMADVLSGPSTLTHVLYLGGGVSFLVWDRGP